MRARQQEMFPSLAGQGMVSLDVETCDPDLKDRGPGWHRDDGFIAGVAVGTEAGLRRYFPVAHAAGENLDKAKVFGWLKTGLSDPKQPKVFSLHPRRRLRLGLLRLESDRVPAARQ
jgi:hypothetical protein